MLKLVVLFVFFACGLAAEPQIQILRQHGRIDPDGSFDWSYETENGISAQEQGQLKNAQSEEPILEVQGSYQYVAPDGTPISVQYVANENGFQPQGAHLPTPPPIPEAIARALDYIASHPKPAPNKPFHPSFV